MDTERPFMTLTATVGPGFRRDDGMERDRTVDGAPNLGTTLPRDWQGESRPIMPAWNHYFSERAPLRAASGSTDGAPEAGVPVFAISAVGAPLVAAASAAFAVAG